MGGGTFFKVEGHKSTSKTIEYFCDLNWQLWRHKYWNMTSLPIHHMQRHSQGGGLKELKPPPPNDQNIDVYFLRFSPTLYCKSRSGALQNALWQYHRRSNTFVITPSGYEFSKFEKYWSSFFHSCVFCATIYNKDWVLPCSASVETSMTFELPTVWIDV